MSKAQAGAICSNCGLGRWKIARTKRVAYEGVRYLKCSSCGSTDKEAIQFDPATNRPKLFSVAGSTCRTKNSE